MPGNFLRKYGVTLDGTSAGSVKLRVSHRKASAGTYATNSDWTPGAGDALVSKDGGSTANIGTLPSYSNGSWEYVLSGTELSAKMVRVIVANAAIDSDDFTVETFGSTNAMYPALYSSGSASNPFTTADYTAQSTNALVVGFAANLTGPTNLTNILYTSTNSLSVDASGRVDIGAVRGGVLSSTIIPAQVNSYLTNQDPATYVLNTASNKLLTDLNGRVQIQVGTGAGQINSSSGGVPVSGYNAGPTTPTNLTNAIFTTTNKAAVDASGQVTSASVSGTAGAIAGFQANLTGSNNLVTALGTLAVNVSQIAGAAVQTISSGGNTFLKVATGFFGTNAVSVTGGLLDVNASVDATTLAAALADPLATAVAAAVNGETGIF